MDTNSISPPKLAQSEQPRCEQTEGHTDTLLAQRDALVHVLVGMNHVEEDSGYCICPRKDGGASPSEHATSCAEARAALALVREAPDA